MKPTVRKELNIEELKAAVDEELARILVDLTDEDIARAMQLGMIQGRTAEEQAELDEINGRILESPFLEIVDFTPVLGEQPIFPLCHRPKVENEVEEAEDVEVA